MSGKEEGNTFREATLRVKLFVMGVCAAALLGLGTLIALCILIPAMGLVFGLMVVIHIPIVCFMSWGSEEDKKAIANYHPPGHE